MCERFHAAIELIGGRWTGAILRAVFTGHHRFGRIREAVPGLSDTMLAQRLRTLEAEGLVERRGTGQAPAEYHLTPMGRELEPVLAAVTDWAHRWIPLAPTGQDPDLAPAAGPAASPSSPAGEAPASVSVSVSVSAAEASEAPEVSEVSASGAAPGSPSGAGSR
ncbi:helix-turn-helix transcriptional regulator [Streptomyces sp. KK5PA1]|uniref:Helix-turn-helix transcriptional regulator n=1 Tax=Actinacidiphila acididurans TaxID=2784346 RepID=A0ABS2U418_9ACTN|nr:helix-turn-helix transcriptional regulator [Actinacidiphila acididurans]